MPKPVVWIIVLGVAATAYVLGAKAGRARYREISKGAKQLWDDPTVKKVRERSRKAIEKAAKKASKKIAA